MPHRDTPAAQRVRQGTARCVYCGTPLTRSQAASWPGVCGSHSDLPARDPNYMQAMRRRGA